MEKERQNALEMEEKADEEKEEEEAAQDRKDISLTTFLLKLFMAPSRGP